MKPKIVIIDYGAGNLRSVSRAVVHVGFEPSVTAKTLVTIRDFSPPCPVDMEKSSFIAKTTELLSLGDGRQRPLTWPPFTRLTWYKTTVSWPAGDPGPVLPG